MAKRKAAPHAGESASSPNKATRSQTSSSKAKPRHHSKQATVADSPQTSHQTETDPDASRLIDERIQSLADWRGAMLAEVRRLIHAADPQITEEWKWKGTPVWSRAGIICTGETYKQVVKLTFARGAALADPHRLFNSSLEGNTRRAIDLREGDSLNSDQLIALVQAAIAENLRVATSRSASRQTPRKQARATLPTGEVVLLSGGNPQIAKGDGDAPVQAYIAAMPGWKSDLGRRLDHLIVDAVPNVQKAVRWNSPFYGVAGQGWFVSFHVLTRYVKVTFFNGLSLDPIPPGGTEKSKEARWIDIYEDDELDSVQITRWIQQAAALPGWIP